MIRWPGGTRLEARKAYITYRKATGGVSLATGQKLPPWSRIPSEAQRHWVATYKRAVPVIQALVSGDLSQAEGSAIMSLDEACQRGKPKPH